MTKIRQNDPGGLIDTVTKARKVLCVTRYADFKAIQRAWRTKVKETHPDRSGNASTAQQFHRVQSAFEFLQQNKSKLRTTTATSTTTFQEKKNNCGQTVPPRPPPPPPCSSEKQAPPPPPRAREQVVRDDCQAETFATTTKPTSTEATATFSGCNLDGCDGLIPPPKPHVLYA